MKNFIVSTDSGADLSAELNKKHEIFVLPMQYHIGNELIADNGDDKETLAFYQKMREGAVPTTGQATPAQFLDFWRPLLQYNLPIVHVCLGSGISGTYQNGVSAAEMLKEEAPDARIFVVDSMNASMGIGMLTIKTTELRDEGKTAEEIKYKQ
jgi:DegV family protein with EDD domain